MNEITYTNELENRCVPCVQNGCQNGCLTSKSGEWV